MTDAPWEDFTADYPYKKIFYDVLLPTGDIVLACWPNAGRMARTWGHGPGIPEHYSPEDNIKVRPALETRPWRLADALDQVIAKTNAAAKEGDQ